MTGSRLNGRARDPVRQVAECRGCGESKEGVTRFESMAYSNKPAGHPIHFCDDCERGIVERPLTAVISDLTGVDL